MTNLYCHDFVETSDRYGHNITIFGQTESGDRTSITVFGVPIYTHLDWRLSDDDINDLRYYMKNVKYQCRSWRCGFTEYGIYRETCFCDSYVCEQPILGISYVQSKGFVVHEDMNRVFTRIEVVNSQHLGLVGNWAKKRGGLQWGITRNGLDSFLIGKKLSSFEWIQVPKGAIRVHYNMVRKVDLTDMPLTEFCFDIEVVAKNYGNEMTLSASAPIGLISSRFEGKNVSFYLKSNAMVELEKKAAMFDVVDFENEEDLGMSAEEIEMKRCDAIEKRYNERIVLESNRGDVYEFDDELEMLKAFEKYFQDCNPDIVSGFNHLNYDVPYIQRRCERLNYQFIWTCLKNEPMLYTVKSVTTNAGSRDMTVIDCPGRIFVDYMVINRDLKLHNHKLETVAEYYGLGGKGDVSYDQIYPYFNGPQWARDELLLYCIRDVMITWGIGQKMDFLKRLVAKAQVLRCRARCSLDRGGSYYLFMMVMHEVNGEFLMPDLKPHVQEKELLDKNRVIRIPFHPQLETIPGARDQLEKLLNGEKYEGGYVHDPKEGIERNRPVITLDFASLYPSAGRTYNVCPTTLVSHRKPGEDVHVCSNGFIFTKSREGVIPKVWRKLMEKRNSVKKEMKSAAVGSDRYKVLNALQLEVKLAANSLYGQLGAKTGKLLSFPCASSITKFGSDKIKEVARCVMERFTVYNAEVKYGDTDSIMVAVDCDVRDAWRVGDEIEKWVNEELLRGQGVLSIEFEDVSFPTLFLSKKRYIKVNHDRHSDGKKLKLAGLDKRTYCSFEMQTVYSAAKKALMEGDAELEIYIHRRLDRLRKGRVSIRSLALSQRKGREISEYGKVKGPGVRAIMKLEESGVEVLVGERIELVYVKCNGGTKRGDSAYPLAMVGDKTPDVKIYEEKLWNTLNSALGAVLTRGVYNMFNKPWHGLSVGQETIFGASLGKSKKTRQVKKRVKVSPQINTLDGFFK